MSTACYPPDSREFQNWARSNVHREELRRAARCGWNAGITGTPWADAKLDHSAEFDAQGKQRAGARDIFRHAWQAGAHRHELAQQKHKKRMAKEDAVGAKAVAAARAAKAAKPAKAPKAPKVPPRWDSDENARRLARRFRPEVVQVFVNGWDTARAGRDRRIVGMSPDDTATRVFYAGYDEFMTLWAKHNPEMAKQIANAARQSIWAIAAADDKSGKGYASEGEIARRLRSVSTADVTAVGGDRKAVAIYKKEIMRLIKSRQAESRAVAKKAAKKASRVLGGRVVRS